MPHPLSPTWKTEWLPVLLVVVTSLAALYFYSQFPAQVATHWNFAGEPDAYGGRVGAAFGFAALVPALYALLMLFPYLDPKRERYAEFRGVYLGFRGLLMAVMLVIYLAAGLWNLGYPVRINYVVPLVIGLLFLFIGNYMAKLKPNWFMGIRTPWTLSSENVWNRTHRVGGWAFVIFGLVLMLTPFLPARFGLWLLVFGMVLLVFGTIVYSYLIFRKEQGQTKSTPPTNRAS